MKDNLKFNLYVSPKNYNRYKCGTHTLKSILSLEGFKVDNDYVYILDGKLLLLEINLLPNMGK